MCRYNFPRFRCKNTILAQPLPLTYANEEEKKIKEKEIADKNEKAKGILEDAKKLLNRSDLESVIERKVLELRILPKWSDYAKDNGNLENEQNLETRIIMKNLSEKDLNATGQEKLRLIDTNYKEMKEAGVNVPMNEDTEMEAFCQLVKPGLTYKTYEEALHTTKKRESSIYEKTNK